MENYKDRLKPHAFHQNLPSHHIDPKDGIPWLTKYCHRRARAVLKLANEIQLTEEVFYNDDIDDMEDSDNHYNEDESRDDLSEASKSLTLESIVQKCSRLHAQMNTLETLKFCGITQIELCEILLHVLRLLTATVTINHLNDGKHDNNHFGHGEQGSSPKRNEKMEVTLHFDDVGYIYQFDPDDPSCDKNGKANNVPEIITSDINENIQNKSFQLENYLKEQFALPSPAREALLSTALMLLSKKGRLASVSNTGIFVGENNHDRKLLILNWKALLRMLIRTAPYLDEHKSGMPPIASASRQNAVLKRTVNLIRQSRRYFDQGLSQTFGKRATDKTARELWDMLQADLIYNTHSNSCFRALIILYLFQPSRCSSGFYENVLPRWMESWSSVDRCPDFDFLWLVMFCRARKFVSNFDWGVIRRKMLTHCSYWLQIPLGGSSNDKLFPNAARARSRVFPARLKPFMGSGSRYDEWTSFVGKVAKLLVFCLGRSDDENIEVENVDIDREISNEKRDENGSCIEKPYSNGTEDFLKFLSFVAPYFNPSNTGYWTLPLGALLHYLSFEFGHRLGLNGCNTALAKDRKDLQKEFHIIEVHMKCVRLPENEIVAVFDVLLPLCQQSIYSKNSYVSRAGETALLFLANTDALHICPPFLDFFTQALDISSVNLSHQAPAALSALTRLIQPSLIANSSILLDRLPEILRLSLAGIDSNDQNKTLRTLIFYRNIASWIPVGKFEVKDKSTREVNESSGCLCLKNEMFNEVFSICRTRPYFAALKQLPENSLLRQSNYSPSEWECTVEESSKYQTLKNETALVMTDWSLAFLERMYALFRVSGEQEKVGKSSYGVASRHASADASETRNFFRIMKECVFQIFSSMDASTHEAATRSIANFFSAESLPLAAKNVSAISEGISMVRHNTENPSSNYGLEVLVPLLTRNLKQVSNKTANYRIRCLSGAVRHAGKSVLHYRSELISTITYAFSNHDDKKLFKAGCKLLRHTISSQCESYPISSDKCPHFFDENDWGVSAQLHNDSISWHIPCGDQIDFVVDILESIVIQEVQNLSKDLQEKLCDDNIESIDICQWRRCFKILRYALRGCSGILLDEVLQTEDTEKLETYDPNELATWHLINNASDKSVKFLCQLRSNVGKIITNIMSLVAKDSNDTLISRTNENTGDGKESNMSTLMHTNKVFLNDTKLCKELSALALVLSTRRGSSFRSQDSKFIWRGQKQLLTDYVASSQTEKIFSIFERCDLISSNGSLLYKDGEKGGKTLSRRLVVNRVEIFLHSVQRNSSFVVPRRLRQRNRSSCARSMKKDFSIDASIDCVLNSIKSALNVSTSKNIGLANEDILECYEGMINGLFALSCHQNVQVRASAFCVIDNALSRFGWSLRARVQRLISSLSLNDEKENGVFGLPSCYLLSKQVDSQGKRTRLAEVMKGICSITSMSRTMKMIMTKYKYRVALVRALCDNHSVMSLLPSEEINKMVHYFHMIFSQFRSKYFAMYQTSKKDNNIHESFTTYLLNKLLFKNNIGCEVLDKVTHLSIDSNVKARKEKSGVGSVHWRNRLVVGWCISTFIIERDLMFFDTNITSLLWETCFETIRNEKGQPLQRVALGLLGRLVTLAVKEKHLLNLSAHENVNGRINLNHLRNWIRDAKSVEEFVSALVLDHKEDSSIGGHHDTQWSVGVEDILKDATLNIAPKILFPFQRTGRISSTFKTQHAQLVQSLLLLIGRSDALIVSKALLSCARKLATAAPSEDQRNQQCTSAEIFAGISRAFLELHDDLNGKAIVWSEILLPFLDDVIPKISSGLIGAYFDAFRYSIYNQSPNHFFELTKWVMVKVEEKLWTHEKVANIGEEELNFDTSEKNGTSGSTVDGFTGQSKLLLLVSAILIELDGETKLGGTKDSPWYLKSLLNFPKDQKYFYNKNVCLEDLKRSLSLISTSLLPSLLNALAHPYEKCREQIAGCLFRICFCYRKFLNKIKAVLNCDSTGGLEYHEVSDLPQQDPGLVIIRSISSIIENSEYSLKDKYRALITARKFIVYCVHLGDCRYEYSDFIIPLLPLFFESVNSTLGEEEKDFSAANRMLEAEVIKGYRYSVAEISVSCTVSYFGTHDLSSVIQSIKLVSRHQTWQVRQAAAHFLRCFQSCHTFLFTGIQRRTTMNIVAHLLADDRREVSSAALSALTGIISATPLFEISSLVTKYIKMANKSIIKKKKSVKKSTQIESIDALSNADRLKKEKERAYRQQTSVFFLCASILAKPYDTPIYIPAALAAVSKHSFEKRAPLAVRETVKKCCAEFKRTHMSDNWEVHKKKFTQEQLESLEDVVSTPHYYA